MKISASECTKIMMWWNSISSETQTKLHDGFVPKNDLTIHVLHLEHIVEIYKAVITKEFEELLMESV